MIGVRTGFLLAAALAAWPLAAHADDATDDVAANPPRLGDEPLCTDANDIVGYRACPAYGEWGENLLDPYVFVQLGMNVRHFAHPGPGVALRKSGAGGSAPAGGDEALTVDERIGFGMAHGLYLALDFEFGNFGQFDSTRDTSRDVVLDGLASIGLRGAIAPLSLSVEAAAGGLAYAYPNEDNYHSEAVLELRGRADVWLAPWFTIGAAAGSSVLHKGEWVAGVFIGFHTHSYAGDRY